MPNSILDDALHCDIDMLFNILLEFHFILLLTENCCYFDISRCFPFPTILQWNSNRIPETLVGYRNAGLHSPLQAFHAKFDSRM